MERKPQNHTKNIVDNYFFLNTRRLATPKIRLEIEAKKLRHLNGTGVPRLIYYDGTTLVREYLFGVSFREEYDRFAAARLLAGFGRAV